MTPRPDIDPADDALLLDALQGELDAAQRARLDARLAAEPALAAARARWERLLDAEREAFEPAAQGAAARADAPRLVAWIRDTARRAESSAARTRFTPARRRVWARVLAWSVGAHVAVLGVLALLAGGPSGRPAPGSAARVEFEEHTWESAESDPAETALAFLYERIQWDDIGPVGDRIALGEQESLADGELRDELETLDEQRPIAWDGLNHPVGVIVPMTRRKSPALKRRRLDLLGFNANGTLKAVDRGLRFLGRRQREDGSFPAGGDRSELQQTALTMLAFLGDGDTSRGRGERDAIVERGVAWMRGRLFQDGEVSTVARSAPMADVASATVALCEDYMLSFGDLPPEAAQGRAQEIAALTDRARVGLEAAQGEERTWRVWALDAAARAGVREASAAEHLSFRNWVQAAASDAEEAHGAMALLSVGTALLFAERGAEKPRFLTWSRANAEQLVERLAPTGGAREGDPVGDTALILLALQVAWRTY